MDGLDAERANNGGFGGKPTYKTIKTGLCRFCRCHSQQISHYSRRLPEVPSEWPSEFLEAERAGSLAAPRETGSLHHNV